MHHALRRQLFSCLIALLFCALLTGCRTEGKEARSASSATPAPLPPETTPAGATVLSDRTVILIGKAALPLFRQCSRASPQGVTGYWTPTAQDIAQLEADASAFLQNRKINDDGLFSHDCRQYAGIVQGNRRIVYVNVLPLDTAQETTKYNPRIDWRHDAIVICDGGSSYFGMEYDVQAHRFQNLSFNGVI